MAYPESRTILTSDALTAICRELLDEWELSPEEIKNLAADIPGECEGILENRAEQAWENRSEPDDTAYRRQMIEAGRGHLLR